MKPSLTSRLIAEAVGTFGFFFIGFSGIAAATLAGLPGPGVAAAFGLGLALMIFAFGHISGGHFNPAVTLGLTAGGKFPAKEILPYWIAQLAGGVVAAAVARGVYDLDDGKGLLNAPQAVSSGGVFSDGKTLVLEIIATALFLVVISAVATDSRAPWNGVLAPVAIGGFIFTAAISIGSLTSGSFNPARSISPAIASGSAGDLWIFIVGPLLGGLIGGALYWFIRNASGDKVEAPSI